MTFPVTALTYGSFAYLKSEVGHVLGYGRHEATWDHEQRGTADSVVQRAVRAFYVPPPLPREKYGHEWSFLRPVLSLSTYAPYATGTITIASGVVTLSVAGTFPSTWAADGDITVGGSTYSVNTYDGPNQVTLDDLTVTVTSASTYSLTHQPIYDLPSDFAMLDGPLTYARTETTLYDPIQLVAEHQVRQRQQDTVSTGRPTLAATRAKAANAGYEILLWPTPDDAYTIEYLAKVNPPVLSTPAGMPYGGTEHLGTIVEACLAEAEAEKGEEGVHAARYLQRLAASVSHDRKQKSPDTLGYDVDRSDRAELDWHDMDANLVLHNGVAY